MDKKEFIDYLVKHSSFIKGGIYDYFEEVDIENGIVVYLNIISENKVKVMVNCEHSKIFTFEEFIELDKTIYLLDKVCE